MIAAALLLLAAGDVRIEKVERLAIDVPRPLSWSPLAVTLASDAGFSGDLRVRSRFGFSVVKAVDVPRGGTVRVIVPALDPEAVEAGAASARVPRPGGRADLAVAVDAGLPYAGELESSSRARFVRVAPDDLRVLIEGGMLDGVDLLLLRDEAVLGGAASPAPFAAAATREEAERAVASARRRPEIEAVDAPVWELAPEGGWVPAKRARGVLFAAGYAFAGFALLGAAARRGRKAFAGSVALAGLAGAAAYAGLFPRGQVWIEEVSLHVARAGGAGLERRIWFAGAATPVTTDVTFPGLAKPVFREAAGTDKPFELRLTGRGCKAEGLSLGPAARACFVSLASASAAPVPEGPAAGPAAAPFERFLPEGAAVERAAGAGAAVPDVSAPGLADARVRARALIRLD